MNIVNQNPDLVNEDNFIVSMGRPSPDLWPPPSHYILNYLTGEGHGELDKQYNIGTEK